MMTSTPTPTGFALQLHERIQYPEAGAYRQIIAKDEKRQAVLVCLSAGTELSSHTSAHDGFMIVIEGQGIFTLEGQEIVLEPGMFVAMPENVSHAVKAIANLTFLKVVDRHDQCQEHA